MEVESRILFDGAFARAIWFNPGAERLFVTFDHWRRVHDDFAPVQASGTVMRAGFAQLCILSARNDWYLNPDLAALRGCLEAALPGYREVRGIGFSMGAYGALLLSRALRLQKVVLVSPQFSIFPQRPPHDRRYRNEAAGLQPGLDDLARDIVPGLQGIVVFDPASRMKDREHAIEIQKHSKSMGLAAWPLSGHPAMAAVREAKRYDRLLNLAIGGDLTGAEFRRLHRAARILSPSYQFRLRKYLLERQARR